jgi:hypothetical protein
MAIVKLMDPLTDEERRVLGGLEAVARGMASSGMQTRVIDRVLAWTMADLNRRRRNRWLWKRAGAP